MNAAKIESLLNQLLAAQSAAAPKKNARAAKPKSAKAAKSAVNSEYIHTTLTFRDDIGMLSAAVQSKFYARRSNLKQLVQVHNSIVDQLQVVSDSNANALRVSLAALEKQIDFRIASINSFLDKEFEVVYQKDLRSEKRAAKKSPRKAAKKGRKSPRKAKKSK